jgi:hypothetical protein
MDFYDPFVNPLVRQTGQEARARLTGITAARFAR